MNGEQVRELMSGLRKQLERYSNGAINTNRAIREVQEKCPHENTEKGHAFEIEVQYDRNEDAENHRPIYEQYSTCKDCGKRWSQQFYLEDDENE